MNAQERERWISTSDDPLALYLRGMRDRVLARVGALDEVPEDVSDAISLYHREVLSVLGERCPVCEGCGIVYGKPVASFVTDECEASTCGCCGGVGDVMPERIDEFNARSGA